jgi:hypothetical protein
MTPWTRNLSAALLAAAAYLGTAQPAAAQFYARPYNPAWGGYGGYSPYVVGGDPYGGYLNGAANVIGAQGQYMINTQQAFQIKERTRTLQMDNRRKAFDEYLYEKANTPTLNDTRVQQQQEELRRSLTNPPQTEIWSGYSLNNILDNAQQMQARGAPAPYVPLNPDILKQVNVSGGNQAGNVGLLKDAGKLKWPYALRALQPASVVKPQIAQVDKLLVDGKKQALTGQVDVDVITQLNDDIDKLRATLKDSVNTINFNDYIVAKRFLSDLDGAVRILKKPDVEKYVGKEYSAHGKSVQELIAYMSQNGLRFAPAVSGQEAAYSALYQALLQYTVGSSTMVAQPTTAPGGSYMVPPR